jgi:hypothetical protein
MALALTDLCATQQFFRWAENECPGCAQFVVRSIMQFTGPAIFAPGSSERLSATNTSPGLRDRRRFGHPLTMREAWEL